MKFTLLGCGTSTGVPQPGCDCAVCTSPDPKNYRSRTAGLITTDAGYNIVIDTGPDFREQVLREKVKKVDAVLYTHHHSDHILGADELRSYNFRQRTSIPCYGTSSTLAEIKRIFYYIFEKDPQYLGGMLTDLTLNPIEPYKKFKIFDAEFEPFVLDHGGTEVLGFRVNNSLVYATDCKFIPERSMPYFYNAECLFLDALRKEPHNTHLTWDESIAIVKEVAPKRAFFIHMSHSIEYVKENAALPEPIEVGYDGLTVEI